MQPQQSRDVIRASRAIRGWFSPQAAQLFAWLDEIQKRNDITGDIFEIGSHHGRSAYCLGAMARPGAEQLAVCDLFADQGANLSGSGDGDLDIFRRNLAPIVERGVHLEVFQASSDTLSAAQIGTNYRFFHIDGGHNCDEALADLNLAAECTTGKGVIVLDDPFRPEWPGVTEALIRFLDAHPGYRAIVVGFNKLVLTRAEHAPIYLAQLAREEERLRYGLGYPWHVKTLPFNGQPLEIFYVPTFVPKQAVALSLLCRYHNPGPLLRPLVQLVKRFVRGT